MWKLSTLFRTKCCLIWPSGWWINLQDKLNLFFPDWKITRLKRDLTCHSPLTNFWLFIWLESNLIKAETLSIPGLKTHGEWGVWESKSTLPWSGRVLLVPALCTGGVEWAAWKERGALRQEGEGNTWIKPHTPIGKPRFMNCSESVGGFCWLFFFPQNLTFSEANTQMTLSSSCNNTPYMFVWI